VPDAGQAGPAPGGDDRLLARQQREGSPAPGAQAVYGQSITDACISIEQTEPLLEQLAKAQQLRGSIVPA
jgi:3-deoxy-D-arabino-heptulosonate 7-phosphate (DAHP) synthase